jgi:hypothetical protein
MQQAPCAPCGHFFCSSCLTHKFVQLRAGASEFEGFACPACGRFVRAVLADPSLDSVVLTLLTPGIHVRVAYHGSRPHVQHPLPFKHEVVELWDKEGWREVRSRFPGLAWSTADYWRRNPAVLASDGDQSRSGRSTTFTAEENERLRSKTLAIPGAGIDDIIPIALRLAEQRAQDSNATPKERARYKKFNGSPRWLADFLQKMDLSQHIPHPVSMKSFCRIAEAQAKGTASPQVLMFV